ncbi:MAG: type II secretion system F family protein [Candidatus Saccharibacteria bacterium]
MIEYSYTARNPKTGSSVKSIIQAQNQHDAYKAIKDQGLIPIDLKVSGSGGLSFLDGITKRISGKDKVLFSRQLSTLINAGLPIIQSLSSVANQTKNKNLKVIIGQVITDVEGGSSFSKALSNYPKVFSPIYLNLVAAGETSGTIDKALERLANQQEKDAEIVSKVRGALIYPAIVLLVMIAVVGFMLIEVLPQVKILYDGLPGTSLPLLTRALLLISSLTIKYWWVVLLTLAILIFLLTRLIRTVGGKRFIDGIKISTPPLKNLMMKLYMARFSRMASTLIESGVPLIQVLEITAKSVNNVLIEESINKAIEKVKGGKSLGTSLKGDPHFLELVPNMLSIGEESGSIEQMMSKTADYYEKEVDTEIKNVSTIIEPVMMVILGVVALIIVAAILLPIYGLAGNSNFTGN